MIVFGKASDIVMGQYVRMLIVADEGLDVIAVIAFQSVGSTYPDETLTVLIHGKNGVGRQIVQKGHGIDDDLMGMNRLPEWQT